MATYVVDAGGAWRRYHPMEVPKGWRMLGTIRSITDLSTGALGCSPDGVYVLINGEHVQTLEQRAVASALTQLRLFDTYHRGKDSLLR